MALIACSECGTPITDGEPYCPNCGAPRTQTRAPYSWPTQLPTASIVALAIIGFIVGLIALLAASYLGK